MPEEIKQEETQTQTQQTQETQGIKKPEVDLVTRVSQVEVKTETQPEGKFNINDLDTEIEKISDPALKKQFTDFKKSLLSGENQKYQEIATLRKEYETKLAQATQSWTPDRLKQELGKPDFVQAAQDVLNNGNKTIDDNSVLSDAEKAELKQLQNKIILLEQSNWQAVRTQQDTTLKTKYANYDPTVIDDVTTNLMRGKIQATREDLWKVIDYDKAVKRAYELGLTDKQTQNLEKAGSMSVIDGKTVVTSGAVERQPKESIANFMRRSYETHTKTK